MSRILKTGTNQVTCKYNLLTHQGIDIVKKSYQLDYIIAHTSGIVVEVVKNYKTVDTKGNSYGNYVKIKHDNGYYTLYAHLKYGSVKVSVGNRVEKGQTIGYMGNTGYTKGAHLHFEVRNEKDKRINPTSYIDSDLPSTNKITCEYRSYDNVKKGWLPKVKDKKTSGNKGHSIGGFQLVTYGGGATRIKSHTKGYKNWNSEVIGSFGNGANDYSGIKGKPIDAIAIYSEKGKYRYRVGLKGGGFLSWVTGYNIKDANNGFAGIIGKEIDRIEVEFL